MAPVVGVLLQLAITMESGPRHAEVTPAIYAILPKLLEDAGIDLIADQKYEGTLWLMRKNQRLWFSMGQEPSGRSTLAWSPSRNSEELMFDFHCLLQAVGAGDVGPANTLPNN